MLRRSALVSVLVAACAAYGQVPQQQQLNATLSDLAKTRETEANLKKRLGDTERDMETIRERATRIGAQLQTSERRVTSQEDALAAVNEKVAAKRKEFEDRKEDYSQTVMSLLRMRELPPTAMFAGGDVQQLLRAASVLETTNQAVAEKATRLRQDIDQLKALQNDAKARDAATKAEKENLKREQQDLAHELAARQKLQARLNIDHARAQQQVSELSRQSQSLQELIGKLAENEKAQAKLPMAPKPQTKLRNFDSKKGSARAPVAGDIIHRFGDRQNATGSYRGMVFKTRPKATVVAPYDGEIVFTGPFRDYGNMVLIKHKNGFISLIAGLGKVNAGLNQTAIRGEPIGTMPETGNEEAYVELRDGDAKPIDPAEWFANVAVK